MSLLKAVTKAEECLKSLAEWIKVSFHCDPPGNIDRRPYQDQPAIGRQMNEIVCDAIALLRNCGQAVRLSALHTYYSALPLTPKTRELFKCYSSKTFSIPDVICSRPLWESESVRILEGHTSAVMDVVFSPDGKKLASASTDHTLRLWDVESAQPIGDALKGHTSWVTRVVFSPDGKKLASASWDDTLRLWDVGNGQPIGRALHGHTFWVDHVVFSPDGNKLASASRDKTLRLWDVESGRPIGDALKGHTQRSATLFSHQTERSLRRHRRTARCGSGTSTTVNPLAMHSKVTPMVSTTLFSHQTERNLHRHHGTARCGSGTSRTVNPSAMHSKVTLPRSDHVVFSPDGKKLASASRDRTLRLWDVDNHQPIGDALQGHANEVNHVVFSPDGKKLASASHDLHVAALGRRQPSTHWRCTPRSRQWGQPRCFLTRRKEACIGIMGQHVAALGHRQRSTQRRYAQRLH